MSVPPDPASAAGGLYRSAHAAGDAEPPRDGATLISVDPSGAIGSEDLPGEDQPRPATNETAGTSAMLAGLSLISRILGFVRNALIGMTLGQAVGNAYTNAQFLPSQIYELLLGGILSSVLIPMLVRRRKTEPDGGQVYTQKLLTFAVVSLGVATVLMVAAAPLITAIQVSGGTPELRSLVTRFAYLILPMIFFLGLSALTGAVLNVRGHFAAPMWAPILNSLVIIAACVVFLVFLRTDHVLTIADMTPARVLVIGGGTLLGMVAQAAGLLPALRKVGFAWKWRWDPRSLGLREIARLAGWMFCYVAANQVAVFVVANLLSRAGANAGLLIFNNVYLLIMMAHGIIGVSIMTALLPRMSAAAADGRFADIKADLTYGIRMTMTALAPIAAAYVVLGTPIAVSLFQGGNFKSSDAYAAGTVLAVAGFTVLPFSISQLCTYTFYSLQGNKTASLINLPVAGIRVISQIVLFAALPLSLAAAGMTAGNGISYLLSAALSMIILRRRIGALGMRTVGLAFLRVLVAAVLAGVAGLLIVHALPGGTTPGKVQALVQLAVGGVALVGVYAGAAYVLRVREVSQVIGLVRRKLGR